MKANEFVKRFGLVRIKYWIKEFTEINKLPDEMINLGFLNELKRLVESHELVDSFGGLSYAERFLNENVPCMDSVRLKKAILDVESCQ